MNKLVITFSIIFFGFSGYGQWQVDSLINYLQEKEVFDFKVVEIQGTYTDAKTINGDCTYLLMRPDSVFSLRPNENNRYEPIFGEGKSIDLYIKKPNGIVGKVQFDSGKYGIRKNVSLNSLKEFINQEGVYEFAFKIALEQNNMTESIYRFSIIFK